MAEAEAAFECVAASDIFPSFEARPLAMPKVPRFRPTNPSILRARGGIWLIVRYVNYKIIYDPNDRTRVEIEISSDHEGFETRNFLHRLDGNLVSEHCAELVRPPDWPTLSYRRVQGLEDLRLFEWNAALWCAGSVRELSDDRVRRMIIGRISRPGSFTPELRHWRMLQASPSCTHQKNWMPFVANGQLRFIRTTDPTQVVNYLGEPIVEHPARFVEGAFRGGSQAMRFAGGWLAVVHETCRHGMRPYYFHRFAWFDLTWRLQKLTRRFVFVKPGIEFAAGLCWSADKRTLIVSFGVDDRAAWLGMFSPSEVTTALGVYAADCLRVATIAVDL